MTIKRLFDLSISIVGLTFLSPLLLTIAVIIKLGSKGPVFYRGVRIGKDFKPFHIYKFRSMVHHAERLGGPSTRASDPRITKIGNILRKRKLDELPQLINVLQGDMSLVGPRPEVLSYAKLYEGEEKKVFSIQPGMTDYASLWDFHEEDLLAQAKNTEEAETMYLEKIRPKKVAFQMKYIQEKSFLTDLKIIVQTLKKLFL